MIYIDRLKFYENYGYAAHMISDVSVDDLHRFAKENNIHRRFYHSSRKHPHYDIIAENYNRAIKGGAKVVTSKEIIRILKNARC